MDKPQDKSEEKDKHSRTSHEAFFLSYGAEDEVSVLLGHEFQFRLCTVKEALSFESARPYRYLTLMYVVSCSGKVFLQSQKNIDTLPLMLAHSLVEHVVCGIEKGNAAESENQDIIVILHPILQCPIEKKAHHACTKQELYPHDVERNDVFCKQK